MIKVLDLEKNIESLNASILRQRLGERERTLVEAAPALLRLARAAKAYSDMTLMANDETDEDTKHHLEDRAEMDWDEMQKALDAFDFSEEKP